MPPAPTDGKRSGAGPAVPPRLVAAVAAGPVALALAAVALGFGSAPLAGLVAGLSALVSLPVALAWLRQARRAGHLAAERDRIRASERRYRSLTEFSADMIVEADLDMVRRYVSPRSLDLLGYAPKDLLGRTAMDFVHPDDIGAFRAAFADLLDGSRDRIVTTQRYRRRDGSYVWTEANVQLVRDAGGGPVGYVGSLRDVEARRAVETALRDSETFLRSVVDGSPDSITVLDLDGKVTFISRNGMGIAPAASRDRILGADILQMWPSRMRTTTAAALAAAVSGAQARFSGQRPSDTGETRHFDILVSPMVGGSGRPERLLVITRDVTAEMAARAAFLESQSRYRLLAENSSDVVLLRTPGPDGATLFASPSCRQVLGYAPEAVIESVDPSRVIHPDDRGRVRALLAGLVPGAGPVRDTHRILRADGTYLWIEAAFHLAERAGASVVVAALRDVSEQQRRAEDLAAAKEMAERAKKVAEDANFAKGDFLATMSHEIRTPMNSILGFADHMLASEGLPDTVRRQAELIRAAGRAMLAMVNDVLDVARIEAGAVELEAIAFDPAALMRESAAIVGGFAGTKALDVSVEIAAGCPAGLVGDEARLRQILLNLLSNAVKFTPHGRVTLRLAMAGESPAGVALRFEVEDTGVGIPAARQHRLFERFDQLDRSVARRYGGSGLGLANSKQLVELMGGEIGVRSAEDEGSTFWFVLTLPRATEPAAMPAPLPPRRRGARILVAEDVEANQRLAEALLEAAGHEILVVGDGAAAVAAVGAGGVELVLMDVRMPGMDGLMAARLIRDGGGPHAGVPIVAMTANVYPEQIEACRRAGMDDHLGKPLDRAQLYATIDRLLAGPAAGDREDAPALARAVSFNAETYAQLGAFLGAARLADVLVRFAALLPDTFAPGPGTEERPERWGADAHLVVSIAGMLGFEDLARCCRAFEAAPPDPDRFAAALVAVRDARDAALPRLAALREAHERLPQDCSAA